MPMYAPTITGFADRALTDAVALRRSPLGFFVGAMLAGAYIGIAMILAISAAAGLPAGVRPLVMGATFGLGLILTVFAGGELFTGYVMYLGFGLMRRTVRPADAAMLMVVVWVGNLIGALILAGLFVAGGGGQVFANANAMFDAYAVHKVEADAMTLMARAILCNWLVCLAIWTGDRGCREVHRHGVDPARLRGGRVRAFGGEHDGADARPVRAGRDDHAGRHRA
jgi:nitrite transporter NirC